MKLILVTGGAGFIGSHLVDELLDKGYEVRVADIADPIPNLAHRKGEFEFVRCDVRRETSLEKAVKGCSIVFHLAAQVGRLISTERPYRCVDIDLKGTMKLLDICNKQEVDRFIFASTSEVLGEAEYTPMDEKHPTKPLSPYGVAKLAAETYCLMYNHLYGLETICPRFWNTYGPREYSSKYRGVVVIFISRVLRNEVPIVHEGCTRVFNYVTDLAEGCRLVMEKGKTGEVYNLSGELDPVDMLSLANMIIELCGKHLEPKIQPATPLDVRIKIPTSEKARRELGYCPKVNLRTGLQRTIEWQKSILSGVSRAR